ncbi:MAG: metallophosphoesterase family protein [Candidatus Caldarchaeum sp.]
MMIAHLSDTHLGRYSGEDEEREKDHYEALKEAVDKITSDHVKTVIHSGDILNKPTVYGTPLKTLVTEFRKLSQAGVRIYFTLGEHDLASYPGTPNPLILDSVLGMAEYVGDGLMHGDSRLAVFGLPRHPKNSLQTLEHKLVELAQRAKNLDALKKILVLHQGITDIHGPAGEIPLSMLPTGFDYYAMGHIHLRNMKKLGRSTLAYPGALHWTKIDDHDECGYYLVDLSGEEPELSWVKLESVRPKLVKEVNEDCLENLVEELLRREYRKKPLLSLSVKTSERKNMKALEQKLFTKYILHGGGIKQSVSEKSPLDYSQQPDVNREMERLALEVLKNQQAVNFFLGDFRDLLMVGSVKEAAELLWKHYLETAAKNDN